MPNQNTENFKRFVNFSPILISDDDWDRFDALPEKIKDKLSSCSDKIEKISSFVGIAPEQARGISLAVRKFYLGELPEKDLPAFIQNRSSINIETASQIVGMLEEKIFRDDSFEKAYAEKVEELSLQKVLQKYPEAGEQLLTGNKIMLKDFPEEVRPSIKNWVSDYTSRLGYIRHDSIQRSQYLFQSPNTKALREEDREKLSFILRAFDENLPLSVNRDTRQIILPNFQTNKPRTIIPNQEAPDKKPQITDSGEQNNELNIQSAQFNFHQKMPFEMKKEDFQRPAPERITPRNLEVRKNEISQKPKIQSLAPPSPQKMIGSVPERQFYQPRTNLVSGISEETPNVNPKNVVNLKEL
ncbi:MAG: hypothetical protein ACOYS2_01515 [Patescibacteria group bacterium]